MEELPMFMKKKLLIGVFVFLVTAGAAFLFLHSSKEAAEEKDVVLAYVDEEPIYVNEWKLIYHRMRTIHRLEKTEEEIQQLALEEAVRIKVQQIEAKKHGIIKAFSYKNFKKQLEEENQRREKALKNGEKVYGPVSFDESAFYDYTLSNTVIKLKEALAGDTFVPAAGELKKLYESKKQRYKKSDTIKVSQIEISFINNQNDVDEKLKEDARNKINEVKKRLNQGESFAKLAKEYNESKQVEEFVMDESTARQDANVRAAIKEKAENLKPGTYSEIFEFNGAYNMIKTIEKKSAGYYTLDEVKVEIKARYIDEKYEAYMDEKVQAASVKIEKDVVAKLKE